MDCETAAHHPALLSFSAGPRRLDYSSSHTFSKRFETEISPLSSPTKVRMLAIGPVFSFHLQEEARS